jgi:type IV pilus assembly protein PilP
MRQTALLVLLAGLATLAQAQAPAAPASTIPPAAAPQPSPSPGATPDPAQAILDQALERASAAGGYTYNPQGRRDPFVSLVKPVGAQGPGQQQRPSGVPGVLIQEVALKGIVRTPEGFVAMLLGTDQKSYFCKTGQRLFDGAIVAMDAASVTFRQEVTDPLSTVKTREIKKSLYTTEEARQ